MQELKERKIIHCCSLCDFFLWHTVRQHGKHDLMVKHFRGQHDIRSIFYTRITGIGNYMGGQISVPDVLLCNFCQKDFESGDDTEMLLYHLRKAHWMVTPRQEAAGEKGLVIRRMRTVKVQYLGTKKVAPWRRTLER